jgi:hypothetical protein
MIKLSSSPPLAPRLPFSLQSEAPKPYVCWFRFAPVASSLSAYHKPWWYWSDVNPNLAIEPGASHCMENGPYFSIQGKSSQSWTMPSQLLDKPNEQIIGFPFVRYIAIPIEPAGRTYLDQMVAWKNHCISHYISLFIPCICSINIFHFKSIKNYGINISILDEYISNISLDVYSHQKSSNCTSHCRPVIFPWSPPWSPPVTPGDLLLEACRWPRCGNRAELGTKWSWKHGGFRHAKREIADQSRQMIIIH